MCSITDIKSGRERRERLPGLENDWWRFLVEICVLGAGSPYGEAMSVQVFGLYTRGLTMVVARGKEDVVAKVMTGTGRESLGLVTGFLLCLLVVYKARQEVQSDEKSPKFGVV